MSVQSRTTTPGPKSVLFFATILICLSFCVCVCLCVATYGPQLQVVVREQLSGVGSLLDYELEEFSSGC